MLWEAELWVVAVSALLMWLPQNVQHEGAHALVAKFYGATDIAIWPFPSKRLSGRFTWAHVQWRWTESVRPAQRASLAPQVLNTLLLLALFAVFRLWEIPHPLFSILTAWYLVNLIDGAVNFATVYWLELPTGTDVGSFFHKHPAVQPDFAREVGMFWHMTAPLPLVLPWI